MSHINSALPSPAAPNNRVLSISHCQVCAGYALMIQYSRSLTSLLPNNTTLQLDVLPPQAQKTTKANRAAKVIFALLTIITTPAFANEHLDCLIEPHLLLDVSSSEIGLLASVPVDTADVVNKGQVIASLRTDVEHAALAVSRTLANSNAEIELLAYDHKFSVRKRQRFNELQQKRMVSAQDIDEVQAAQDAAQLRLQAATEKQHRAQLEAVRDELALARRIVVSPIDGVVVSRYKSAGEYVDGDPILQLAQLNPLRIELVAPISMYDKIKVGMQATVSPEMPVDGPLVATVTHIDPMMDAATATFGVRLSLPNPAHRLPPGLRCTLVLRPYNEPAAAIDNTADHKVAPTNAETATPSPNLDPALSAATACDPHATMSDSTSCAESNLQIADLKAHPPMNDNGVASTPEKNTACTTLGPITDASNQEQLAQLLSAKNFKFKPRYESTLVQGSPWTVLSSHSHEQPQAIIDQAQRAHIRDIQWFRSGARKHRFSFGQFRDEHNAIQRTNQMRKLGFEVELVPSRRTESALWLDLSHPLDDPALNAVATPFTESLPGLSVSEIACPQVASR